MKRSIAVFALLFTVFGGCSWRPSRRRRAAVLRAQLPATAPALAPVKTASLTSVPPVSNDQCPPTCQQFKLTLAGIECQFCARSAVELLETIPGVRSAVYVVTVADPVELAGAGAHKSVKQITPPTSTTPALTTGEIVQLLDDAYQAAKTGRAPDTHVPHARHQCQPSRYPGYVQLTFQPAAQQVLSSAQIQAVLAPAGFSLVARSQI